MYNKNNRRRKDWYKSYCYAFFDSDGIFRSILGYYRNSESGLLLKLRANTIVENGKRSSSSSTTRFFNKLADKSVSADPKTGLVSFKTKKGKAHDYYAMYFVVYYPVSGNKNISFGIVKDGTYKYYFREEDLLASPVIYEKSSGRKGEGKRGYFGPWFSSN